MRLLRCQVTPHWSASDMTKALKPTPPSDVVVTTLFAAASIGVGVALLGGGLRVIRDGDWSRGMALMGLGVGIIGLLLGVIRAGQWPGAMALVGGGVAGIGASVAWICGDDQLLGAAVIEVGMALICFAMAGTTGERHRLLGLSGVGWGLNWIGLGVAETAERHFLVGVPAFGVGVATIGAGMGLIRYRKRVVEAATTKPRDG